MHNASHIPNQPHYILDAYQTTTTGVSTRQPTQDATPSDSNNSYQWRNFMQQPSQVRCHRCDKFRHAANVCRSRSHNHFETKDNFISQTPAHDPCIVDSGLSHHITSNQFPTQCSILQGMDDKTMSNGNVIPITHIGTTRLYASNNDFELSTILYAPAIKRKLI